MLTQRSLFAMAVLARLAFGSPATAQDAGAATYKTFCAACHSLDWPRQNGVGPTLAGVFGRKAGAMPGYAYSAAMKAYGKVWTAANLDAFLLAPRDVVPGTKMTFFGVKDPARRAGLIAYLKAQK